MHLTLCGRGDWPCHSTRGRLLVTFTITIAFTRTHTLSDFSLYHARTGTHTHACKHLLTDSHTTHRRGGNQEQDQSAVDIGKAQLVLECIYFTHIQDTYARARACACVHRRTQTHTCAVTQTHTHTHTHARARAHTHTHTQGRNPSGVRRPSKT